jgi:pSer/pThr/pTyr-binding forkhead associated (FHA) protein
LDLSVFTEGQAIYVRTSGVPGTDSPASLEEASTRRKFALAFPLCRLGRDPVNDVVVNGDDSVSRFHAEIAFEDGAFYVNDKGSTNGTFLNGKPVIRRTALADGDRVRVGRLRFKFLLEIPLTEDGYKSFFREPEELAAPVLESASKLNMTLDMAMPEDLRSKLEDKIVAFDAPDNRTVAIPKKIANLITELEDLSPFPGSVQAQKSSAGSSSSSETQTPASADAIALTPPAEEPNEAMALEPPSTPQLDEAIPQSVPESNLYEESTMSDSPDAESNEPIALAPPLDSDAQESIPLGAPSADDSADVIARAAATANGSDELTAHDEPAPLDPIAVIARAAAAVNGSDDLIPEDVPADPTDVIARVAKAANGAEEPQETLEASEEREPGPVEMETPEPSDSQYQTGSTGMDRDFPSADKEVRSPEPTWCDLYLPQELGRMETELAELNEVVVSAQQKIREVESRIALTRGLRASLLAGKHEELNKACGRVLELLGWGIIQSQTDPEEIVLTDSDSTVAIGRIVWTTPDSLYQHLGKLAMAQVAHWCQHRSEPAGLLIVNTFGHETVPEGKEVEFNEELEEFAKRKNVCVMTTLQLLCIYKELDLGNNSPDSLRQNIVATTGRLPGYKLEPTGALVTA